MANPVRKHVFQSGGTLELLQADITAQQVDAIVNAANDRLIHGGGVASVISARGGPEIQQESTRWVREHGPVPHDAPALTRAGRLPCRYVIHAVGPIWGEGDEDRKLANAIQGSLLLADKQAFTSLAFPPISTGIFGFPKERAAGIFYKTINRFFQDHPASSLRLIRLTIIDDPTLVVFTAAFDRWLSAAENNPPA